MPIILFFIEVLVTALMKIAFEKAFLHESCSRFLERSFLFVLEIFLTVLVQASLNILIG